MSKPRPFETSRFETLPKNITMIEYEEIKGLTMKLETKLTHL